MNLYNKSDMPNLPIIFVKPGTKMQMKTSSPWPVPFFCHSLLGPTAAEPLELVRGHPNPRKWIPLGHFISLGRIPQHRSAPSGGRTRRHAHAGRERAGFTGTEDCGLEGGCVGSGWAQAPLAPFISPVGRAVTQGRLQSIGPKSGTESGRDLLYRMRK